MSESLKNDKVSIDYREDEKEIFARDLTDHFNDPAIYTKTKRGVPKAWGEFKVIFSPETSMHDLITFLQDRNIRTHYWCMVD